MQFPLAVAVAACLAPAVAHSQFILIYREPQSFSGCDAFVPPSSQETFYVLAQPWTGILGAEFRIHGGPPPQAGWVITTTPSPTAFLLGDPFGSGIQMAFSSCQSGTRQDPLVLLCTVQAFNVSDTNDYGLHAGPATPPSNPNFPCPAFVLCDAPVFTQTCVSSTHFFLHTTSYDGVLEAHSPQPLQGATDVALDSDLAWTPGTQTCCFPTHGPERQDVYFGTEPDPPLVFSSAYYADRYDPGLLQPRTTYFWRVNLSGLCGADSTPVWSFTTGDAVAVQPAAWSAVKELFR